MIFVFDLDDTVCDTDYYSEKYILQHFKKYNLPYKKTNDIARFAEKKFDWSSETALSWYKEYGDQMMLEFPCKKGSKELINSLYDNGHNIVIATARAQDWHTDPENITKQWLANEGIKYHKLYIGRIDKEKICEEVNADIFVDDDIKITRRVSEHFMNNKNGRCFIMNTDYNKTIEIDENIIRINDFNEFKNILKEEGLL